MKKMYSLQMESNSYADDICVCSTPLGIINYCRRHDIFVDGAINRIALVSIDDDGCVDLVHALYRIDYFFSERYLIPVNYDGTDM